MKTLITGANGYIGSHLAQKLLANGHSVNALVLKGTDFSHLKDTSIELFPGDIRDRACVEAAVEGCETVYHLASLVGFWHKDAKLFHEINVKGTENLLRVCSRQGVRRVLICSSCGIFGPTENGEYIDENRDHGTSLTDPYELSKYKQVQVGKRFMSTGIEVVFVYPTRVFGPGIETEGHSFTRILEGAVNGTWNLILGDGKSVGNYIFVDDIVKGMELAMNYGRNGEGYILSGTNATYDQLFRLLQKISDKKLKLKRVPYPVLYTLGWIEEMRAKITGKKPFITRFAAKKYTSDWRVSNRKIRTELGFIPTPFEKALRMTVAREQIRHAVGVREEYQEELLLH